MHQSAERIETPTTGNGQELNGYAEQVAGGDEALSDDPRMADEFRRALPEAL